jgi:hypothetical protein
MDEMNTTKIVPVPCGVVSASRRGYILTAAVLLAVMAGGTLPVPLYVLYEQQMGFGPLGVTVVFAAYVAGKRTRTLSRPIYDRAPRAGRWRHPGTDSASLPASVLCTSRPLEALHV